MKLEYILISLSVAFLWGLAPIFQKHFLKRFDKASLMLLFSFSYAFIVAAYSLFNQTSIIKDISFLSNGDFLKIITYVFFTIFLTNLLILHVLKSHDAYVVVAFEATAPLFTLLIVCLFFNENVTTIGVLGVLLIVLGVFCVSLNDAKFKIEEFIGLR